MDIFGKMDKLGRLALWCAAVAVALMAIGGARADTGWEGATRIERGRYGAMRKVVGSSVAGAAFFSDDVLRPDGFCFNNSANTVWVGTVSATERGGAGFLHDNILVGTPWTASGTFTLDGSFVGSLYVTCDAGIASCDIRCIDGKVP